VETYYPAISIVLRSGVIICTTCDGADALAGPGVCGFQKINSGEVKVLGPPHLKVEMWATRGYLADFITWRTGSLSA
jgi:hypothetical protein